MLNWRKAKLVIRNHIKEMDDDWRFCRQDEAVELVHEIDYYFGLVVDGYVEFDSTKHFRDNGRQVPRYYETQKQAQDAALEMLRRVVNHEVGIGCDDVSRVIV